MDFPLQRRDHPFAKTLMLSFCVPIWLPVRFRRDRKLPTYWNLAQTTHGVWRSHNYSLCIQPWDLKTPGSNVELAWTPANPKISETSDLWLWLGTAPKFYDRFPIRLGKRHILAQNKSNLSVLIPCPITPNLNTLITTNTKLLRVGNWHLHSLFHMLMAHAGLGHDLRHVNHDFLQSCRADPLPELPLKGGNIWGYYQWEMWKVVVSETLGIYRLNHLNHIPFLFCHVMLP